MSVCSAGRGSLQGHRSLSELLPLLISWSNTLQALQGPQEARLLIFVFVLNLLLPFSESFWVWPPGNVSSHCCHWATSNSRRSREGNDLSSQLLPVNYLAAAKEAATVSINVYDCCSIDLYTTVKDLDISKIDICVWVCMYIYLCLAYKTEHSRCDWRLWQLCSTMPTVFCSQGFQPCWKLDVLCYCWLITLVSLE